MRKYTIISILGCGILVLAGCGLLYNSSDVSVTNYKLNADPAFCSRYPQYCRQNADTGYFDRILDFSSMVTQVAAVGTMSSAEASQPPKPTEIFFDKVVVSWYKEIKKDDSAKVVVVLANRSGADIVPTIEQKGQDSKASQVSPVTLPKDLIGKTIDVYARAKFTANEYKINLATPEWQQLNKPEAKWVWDISPLKQGNHPFSITLGIAYRVKDTGEIFARGLSLGKVFAEGTSDRNLEGELIFEEGYEVKVYSSWITKDSLNLGSVLTGVVGAGLTIPFLFERYKEFKKRRDKKKAERARQRKREAKKVRRQPRA